MDLAVIKRAAPFQDVADSDLEALLPSFRRLTYRAGEALWHEGDPADHLWLVIRGQVRSVVTSEDGAVVVLQVMGAGESFGEPALFLHDTPRATTTEAVVDSEVVRLGREPLLRFLETHPPALRRMLEAMSRLIFEQGGYRRSAYLDVRGRLAYQLLRWADEYGEPVAGGTRIQLKLSQSTLAGLLAISRESVSRALSSFIASGDLRREGGHLVVTKPEGLRAALVKRP